MRQPDSLTGVQILLVEDDRETREMIAKSLDDQGCRVTAVGTCAAAGTALKGNVFQIVILDVGLPDGSGIELCLSGRRAGMATPILILTARADVGSRVAGLDAGADDYLLKPFALAELRARLRAILRRTSESQEDHCYRNGELSVDFSRRLVLKGGIEIPITRREIEVFARLARARGHVVSRDDILEEIWGEATEQAGSSLEVIIGRLRRKLDAPGSDRLIRTVFGHGYALAKADSGDKQ